MMGQTAGEPVLALSGVQKRYGKLSALDGLDLHVRSGDVYGLLGRNGAGKSTSLRIVMGITQPDSGSIALFGQPTKARDVRIRQRVGYVAQEQHFYEWMVPEQLGRFVGAFYPGWDRGRFRDLLSRFEVPPRKVRTLSGGMKAKLGLALALAHRPELLVLDEPTAGLDAVARREFLEIVRDQAAPGAQSTLFSSHLIDDVELVSDRVGIIEGGRMLYEGSLGDLGACVRRLKLPAAAHSDPNLAQGLAAGLPFGILEDRVVRDERVITFWAHDARAFDALGQRIPQHPLAPLPLEEIFIAIVRSERRAG